MPQTTWDELPCVFTASYASRKQEHAEVLYLYTTSLRFWKSVEARLMIMVTLRVQYSGRGEVSPWSLYMYMDFRRCEFHSLRYFDSSKVSLTSDM